MTCSDSAFMSADLADVLKHLIVYGFVSVVWPCEKWPSSFLDLSSFFTLGSEKPEGGRRSERAFGKTLLITEESSVGIC